jgi:LmbE family N-acetylglucosaminyl deacetylase
MSRLPLTSLSEIATGSPPVPFEALDIPNTWTVVVMAPHPDDFDAIACSLNLLHQRGNAVFVEVLTSGASGVEDSFCAPSTKEAKESIREQEQRDSAVLFGLRPERVRFLHLLEGMDGSPLDNAENARTVFDSLQKIRPDLIFMPHAHDSNAGHRRCYRMVKQAVAKLGISGFLFLNEDPKTITIVPSVFTGFGKEEADTKGGMLLCHRSQQQRNLNTRGHGFDERILNFNRSIATRLGIRTEFAEAFEIEPF